MSCAVAAAVAGCAAGATAGPVQGPPSLLHNSSARQSAGRPSTTAPLGSTSAPPYQVTLDRYAGEISAAAHAHGPGVSVAGYCSIVLDPSRDGLTVYWQGTPAPAVRKILNRAAAQGCDGQSPAKPVRPPHTDLGVAEPGASHSSVGHLDTVPGNQLCSAGGGAFPRHASSPRSCPSSRASAGAAAFHPAHDSPSLRQCSHSHRCLNGQALGSTSSDTRSRSGWLCCIKPNHAGCHPPGVSGCREAAQVGVSRQAGPAAR